MTASNRKAIAIGIVVALALILLNPTVSPISVLNKKSCSTDFGFKYYDRLGIAKSVNESKIMAIGTVNNVETKAVDHYENIPYGPNWTDVRKERFGVTPWKFVTFEVEKYLFDKTGKYSKVITFRAPANECIDSLGIVSSYADIEPGYQPGTYPEYHKADKALIEIPSVIDGEFYSGGGYKFDLAGDKVLPNEKMGLTTPIGISTLENQITNEIERQGPD
jgi:hypothetical protein